MRRNDGVRQRFRCRRDRGFTLPELLLLIVVLAVGLAGVATGLQQAVRGSGDPLVQKQALAIAEALMEEILLQPFTPVAGGTSRADFNDVSDYDGYSSAGVTTIDGAPVAGLAGYSVSVAVANAALGPVTAVDSKRISVTVTGPGVSYTLDGYKLNYGP
ncbi:MAG: prepilin-type N-terminal cleavage/methylation domain-containing protein [Burkholderiales bacterium]|nr:prepilin-type N-terminal cleavage/methylation domain-containing protein [Burkholderiales bacterium]